MATRTPQQVQNLLRWAEAMESGRYKKGTGYYRFMDTKKGDCYCALGVACDIYDPGGWHNIGPFFGHKQMLSGYLLKDEAMAWFGLTSNEAQAIAMTNDGSWGDDNYLAVSALVRRIALGGPDAN